MCMGRRQEFIKGEQNEEFSSVQKNFDGNHAHY